MKKITVLILCILVTAFNNVSAQYKISKPKKPTGRLAMTRQQPAPKLGHMVSFKNPDSSIGQAFHLPATRRSENALLIIHEWWSLNGGIDIHVQKEAKRWQELLGDIDVYVLDIYDSRVAASLDEARKLAAKVDPKRGENLVKGVINHIGQERRVATLGYCTGGTWAFNAATIAGTQIAGCVMYYAEPIKNAYQIRDLHSDVFYVWATKDEHVNKVNLGTFKRRVESSGHTFQVAAFEKDHAFANKQNPMYDPASALKAEKQVVSFLKQKLMPEKIFVTK
ncbi:MAG: hypothetical protein EOP56_15505 [Sphingobacteriales bacterium]|nr:MAG: hypothetical protein EOP56_15505 [Sphingobacteriales bacterium]